MQNTAGFVVDYGREVWIVPALELCFATSNATGLEGPTALRRTAFMARASLIKDFNSRLSFGAEVFAAWTDRRASQREYLLTTLVGGSYAFRDNFSFDFGVHGGKGHFSPRVGVVIGFSMDFK